MAIERYIQRPETFMHSSLAATSTCAGIFCYVHKSRINKANRSLDATAIRVDHSKGQGIGAKSRQLISDV